MRLPFTLFIFACVVVLGSAQAACGGGGWKNNSKNGTAQAPANSAAPSAQNVSYQQTQQALAEPSYDEKYYAPRAKALETSHLDAITSKLELSKDQSARIDEARQSIGKQVHDLNQIKINSERAFDACTGTCDKERQTMRLAIEAAQRYSATAEFDKQVRTILDAKQLAIYDGKQQEVSTK